VVTPPKGDVLYLPLTPAGRQAAMTWDPVRDTTMGEACRAFGAPGVMRMPTRLHITWQDPTTLRVDTDTGMQTRLMRFGAAPPQGAPSWQGDTRAVWQPAGGGGRRGGGPPPEHGSLRAVTTNMRPGYFRRNGVPYGANATLTEYFTTITEDDGNTYLVVTPMLEDGQYINGQYIKSMQFKKEPDGSKWNPLPCWSDYGPLASVAPEGGGR
jgi:hypothetical protein